MSIVEHALDTFSEAGFVFGLGKTLESLNAMTLDVARTDIPVLITGESGTGKDAYAGFLHHSSASAESSFHKISCAQADRASLLRQLSESLGTRASIYLDQLDELDLDSQKAVLALLPDSPSRTEVEHSSPRFISSCTRNLEPDLASGKFRRELYFRLNCISLSLPSLRQRKEDIPLFMEHFLKKHAQSLRRMAPLVDDGAMAHLGSYHWPGNLRELENVARKTVALGNAEWIVTDIAARMAVPEFENQNEITALKVASKAASQKAERELILQALERTRWNRKKAARDLQISYKSLLYKIKQIGVPVGQLHD